MRPQTLAEQRSVMTALALFAAASVTYGQPGQAGSKPVRFMHAGHEYTVQSAVGANRLEVIVRYSPAADRSSVRPGELRLTLGPGDLAFASRTNAGSTIGLTQAGPRATATISRDGQTIRKQGTATEVMTFFEQQDQAWSSRDKTDVPLGELVAKDPGLRAQLQKALVQTIAEWRDRHRKEPLDFWGAWEERCREHPEDPGCPKYSLCGRADDGCKGGCMVCCGVAIFCDLVDWVGEP